MYDAFFSLCCGVVCVRACVCVLAVENIKWCMQRDPVPMSVSSYDMCGYGQLGDIVFNILDGAARCGAWRYHVRILCDERKMDKRKIIQFNKFERKKEKQKGQQNFSAIFNKQNGFVCLLSHADGFDSFQNVCNERDFIFSE